MTERIQRKQRTNLLTIRGDFFLKIMSEKMRQIQFYEQYTSDDFHFTAWEEIDRNKIPQKYQKFINTKGLIPVPVLRHLGIALPSQRARQEVIDSSQQRPGVDEDNFPEKVAIILEQNRKEKGLQPSATAVTIYQAQAPIEASMTENQSYVLARPGEQGQLLYQAQQEEPIHQKRPHVDKNQLRLDRGLPKKGHGRYSQY